MGIKLYNFGTEDQIFKPGDKVAQLIVYPLIQADVEWTDQVVESARGEKGFGSSDKK
jgi:dUTP pyrophosphatase